MNPNLVIIPSVSLEMRTNQQEVVGQGGLNKLHGASEKDVFDQAVSKQAHYDHRVMGYSKEVVGKISLIEKMPLPDIFIDCIQKSPICQDLFVFLTLPRLAVGEYVQGQVAIFRDLQAKLQCLDTID